jgi:anhydro-N-acetylmuramic acid kinase
MRALGLMSGTSLDGVDAAILETDGEDRVAVGPSVTVPYAADLRARLRAVLGDPSGARAVERALTEAHAAAVAALLVQSGLGAGDIDVIGFHGQTVLHRPGEHRTWQIGDGDWLAQTTGIRVVNDFRSADVRAGGQGAPLAPVYHRALAAGLEKPVAVVNIGGVANVTWIGADGALLAFDTGPGNALIDDWLLKHTGQAIDRGGELARSGAIAAPVLANLLRHGYFDAPPPKSLDRNDFDAAPASALSPADGARTLTAFTARAIAASVRHFPAPPLRWLICGGGRHNETMMAELASVTHRPVAPVEAVGWRGDSLEAEAFAYLAVRVLKGLPTSFPSTTGARQPVSGGQVHAP